MIMNVLSAMEQDGKNTQKMDIHIAKNVNVEYEKNRL